MAPRKAWGTVTRDLYLDYNGSTPVDPAVEKTYLEHLRGVVGNPSAPHPGGRRAREVLEASRSRIAASLGARPEELFFTSGGTESNNWAILGSARRARGRHVVLSPIEHKSVLATAAPLMELGFEVSHPRVGDSGAVELEDLRECLRDDTFLVSVMLANNETGVLQPAAAIGRLCREREILFHCDAVAAIGKVAVNVEELHCDLLSLSSHKLYAPKGCGLLYVRGGVELAPMILGCGQQAGQRSGTENPAGIAAFAKSFERMESGAFRGRIPLDGLRDELWRRIRECWPQAERNGTGESLPNTLSVSFPGHLGADLQADLGEAGISVASGAAGSGGAPSHVLMAMGLAEDRARSTLRFSLGAETVPATIDACCNALELALLEPNRRKSAR